MKKMQARGLAVWGINLIFFLFCATWALAEEVLPPPGKPLTLEECIAIAVKYHPSLAGNQATVEAQKARVEQALSAYYPQVSFNTSYNANTFNFVSLGGAVRQFSYNWTFVDVFSTGPTLNQTIYDFGRTSNTVKINRENVRASQEDFITTKQTVILGVQTAYYSVLQTQYLIDVAQDIVTQTQQHLDQAQGFYQAGTRPKIDVTKAEVDVANAQLALIQAKNNFGVARVTLNNAMGLRQDLNFAVEKDIEVKPKVIPLEEILKTAYERRPEILKLMAQERSQEATIKFVQADGYYPKLSGNAQYLVRGFHMPNDTTWDIFFGATLTIPIFNGYITPNQIAEARATLRNLQAQEESTRQNIRLEAEQAYLSLKLAIEQIEVTKKSVEQAKENYDLASGRYQVGVGSPLEITDAEVQLANARALNIQAIYGFKTAEARIEKAMGINR